MTITYDFRQQKVVGQHAEAYLDSYFSRWYVIMPATPMQQRQGIDRHFTRKDTGASHTVEYKTDHTASATGNAFVELISVDCRFVVGWAYSSCADYLIYLVPDMAIYVVRFQQLRLQLPFWTRQYEMRSVQNKGYQAKGLVVPLGELNKLAQQVMEL